MPHSAAYTAVLLVALALLAASIGISVCLQRRGGEREQEREMLLPMYSKTHLLLQKQQQQQRKVLVLDLDETLVHSLPPDYSKVLWRPQVLEFLQTVRGMYDEVVVFTAGTRDYASPVLDGLDPRGSVFGRRFYRDSCSILTDHETGDKLFVKDLRILGERDAPSNVRIVDNTPSAYALQPECGVPVRSFLGDPADKALMQEVLPVLKYHVRTTTSSPY